MTIAARPRVNEYQGQAAPATFPVTFEFFAANELDVVLRSAAGVETDAVGYTVAGGDGGTGQVMFPAVSTIGFTVVLRGATKIDQQSKIPEGGKFPTATIERGLDRGIAIAQEQRDAIDDIAGRALTVPNGEAAPSLGTANERANSALIFDQNGNPVTKPIGSFPAGPAGPADNTYTSYAAMQASDPTRRSARLVADTDVPSHPDGPYNNPTQTIGGWVAQRDQGIAWSNGYTQADFNSLSYPFERYIPKAVLAGIRAGTSVDATPYVQAAIDDVSFNHNGGYVDFGDYRLFCNAVMKPGVILRGRETTFSPFANDHVFKGPATSCVRFGWENLNIRGNLAFANQDGLNIVPTTTGTFYDTIYIKNVRVFDCGRENVFVRGTSSSGPFVQHLIVENLTSDQGAKNSLHLQGAIFETLIKDSFLTSTRDNTGASAGLRLSFTSEGGGSFPGRTTCVNTAFSNPSAQAAGAKDSGGVNNAPAVFINAAASLNFFGCSFEFCDPCIVNDDFVFAQGFTAIGCSAGIISPVDSIIRLKRSTTAMITGWKVLANANFFIRLDGDATSIQGLVEHSNDIGSGIANRYGYGNTGFLFLSNPAGTQPGSLYDYGRDNVVVRKYPGDGNGYVDFVREPAGNAGGFNPNRRITLMAFVGDSFVVRNGGNITTVGGGDVTRNGMQTITLAWNPNVAKWWEVGRNG